MSEHTVPSTDPKLLLRCSFCPNLGARVLTGQSGKEHAFCEDCEKVFSMLKLLRGEKDEHDRPGVGAVPALDKSRDL